mmetsp:Transcript_12537/g.14144  ORF Transcript_12537/g.14144 Transcript_12537/m.14144 type:complete len:99 (+) Transcript_12537:617-913(+)
MDIQHLNQLLHTQQEEAAQALNAVAMSARRRTNILLHEKDVQNELEKENLMNEAVDAVQYILSEASTVSQSSATTAAAVAASVSTDTVCLVLLLCGRE